MSSNWPNHNVWLFNYCTVLILNCITIYLKFNHFLLVILTKRLHFFAITWQIHPQCVIQFECNKLYQLFYISGTHTHRFHQFSKQINDLMSPFNGGFDDIGSTERLIVSILFVSSALDNEVVVVNFLPFVDQTKFHFNGEAQAYKKFRNSWCVDDKLICYQNDIEISIQWCLSLQLYIRWM